MHTWSGPRSLLGAPPGTLKPSARASARKLPHPTSVEKMMGIISTPMQENPTKTQHPSNEITPNHQESSRNIKFRQCLLWKSLKHSRKTQAQGCERTKRATCARNRKTASKRATCARNADSDTKPKRATCARSLKKEIVAKPKRRGAGAPGAQPAHVVCVQLPSAPHQRTKRASCA